MNSLPWDDPDHDVMADIKYWLRSAYEKWPVPPFEPFYTPAEQRILDEWKNRAID